MNITITGPHLGKADVCEPILRALPQWFGIEEAIVEYILSIEVMPTFLALADEQPAGFLSIKRHSDYSAEIFVMAVAPVFHRRGVGRRLVDAVEKMLREQRVEYLQVKTLSAAHPSLEYAQTRMFYLAVGFRPLEEFPTLWNPSNPCLLMVKSLHGQD